LNFESWKLASKGFAMGAADVVPGVSGGTIAFIAGIYEQLIDAIYRIGDPATAKLLLRFRLREWFEQIPWRFLITLGAGILAAILTLSHLIEVWLAEFPALVWSFFFGLVAASVAIVFRRVKKWTPGCWAMLSGGSGTAFLLVGLVPAQTPSTWWFLFISGAIAICAMILPGISGSFILLLLGQYQTVLGAINDRNLGVIAIVGAGATVGILSFTRILHWLLARFHDVTIAALIGFMAGSLRKIWPWKETLETAMVRDGQPIPIRQINVLPDALNVEVGMAVGLAAVGFAAVLLLESAARTRPDSG
jgi:putative membrane protein